MAKPFGCFPTPLLEHGVTLYGGFDGSETSRSARDPQTNVTILDANHESSTSMAVLLSEDDERTI